jgi:hypothetical protein
MDDLWVEILGHAIVILFLLSAIVFAFVTYWAYKKQSNRGLAAISLLATLTLFGLYLYHAYLLGKFGGFF